MVLFLETNSNHSMLLVWLSFYLIITSFPESYYSFTSFYLSETPLHYCPSHKINLSLHLNNIMASLAVMSQQRFIIL